MSSKNDQIDPNETGVEIILAKYYGGKISRQLATHLLTRSVSMRTLDILREKFDVALRHTTAEAEPAYIVNFFDDQSAALELAAGMPKSWDWDDFDWDEFIKQFA